MGDPVKNRATYDDVLRAPPHVVAEVVAGELVLSPRPKPRHSLAATKLTSDLTGRLGHRGREGWLLLFEPELHFGRHDILVPDIGGWKGQTLADICDVSENIVVRPTWVCEVLSPSTEKYDRGEKLAIYAEYSVSFCWLVNPVTRTLEVFRRQDQRWELLMVKHDDVKVTAEPFDFELDLSHLWIG